MARRSYRVKFLGGCGFELAGIVDTPGDDAVASGPAIDRPVAVFSHCFTCNKDFKAIVRISRGLAEQGITVLRFDMTGLGGSDGDFADTSFSTNLQDLRAAIEFASDNIGPVTALIGHSFGGAASLALAGSELAAAAGSIAAVVTIAAPSETQRLAKMLVRMDPAVESSGSGTVTIGGIQWPIRRQLVDDCMQFDLPAAISRIAIPTLIFQSPHDETLGFDHALRIMSLIQASPGGGAPASLVALDRADHLLTGNKRDTELVVQMASAFLHRYANP